MDESRIEEPVLKPVRKERVSRQVFDQLKEQIIKGQWPAGTKLPSENELARQMGVSRVSIRTALQMLSALGLLETRHGEGTYVRELAGDLYFNALFPLLALSKTNIFDVLEYRRVLDPGVVVLATERASEEDLEELERIYHRMEECKDDFKAFAHADLEFHLAIAKATRNPIFIKVNTIIQDILNASMEGIVRALGIRDGLHYHREILQALRTRDAMKAERLMREHVERTIHRLKEGEEDSDGSDF
ncbi:MAG: FadR/GntR family transcriptional regulator [Spirochaetales bacterium]